jgi:HEAT repeat protein
LGRLAKAIDDQQEKTLELLLKFLGSKSDFVREAAIAALQSLGEREAVSHLRQVADYDVDTGVRKQAQRAIDAILRDRGNEQVSENFKRIEDLQDKQAELEKKIESMQEEIKTLNENTKADDINDEEK